MKRFQLAVIATLFVGAAVLVAVTAALWLPKILIGLSADDSSYMPICPGCHSVQFVATVDAMPKDEVCILQGQGKISQGCVRMPVDPLWYCKQCHRAWPLWHPPLIPASSEAYTATYESGDEKDNSEVDRRTISSDGKGHILYLDPHGKNSIANVNTMMLYDIDPEQNIVKRSGASPFHMSMALAGYGGDVEERFFKVENEIGEPNPLHLQRFELVGLEDRDGHECRHWLLKYKIGDSQQDYWFDSKTGLLVRYQSNSPSMRFYKRLVSFDETPASEKLFVVPSDYRQVSQ